MTPSPNFGEMLGLAQHLLPLSQTWERGLGGEGCGPHRKKEKMNHSCKLFAVGLAALSFILIGGAARAENIVYPADSGVVDATKAPYNAYGDGIHDDTGAIQSALTAADNSRKIVYLPNGTYLVSSTLNWPATGGSYGYVNLQGQSMAGAIIKLKNGVFTNSASPAGVMNTGHPGSADRFANSVRNLTIDTGTGNLGAVGLQFFSNNSGCVRDVTIRSGDGQGAAGLDMGYNNENGPLLIKNVTVSGFKVGVTTGNTVNSQTMENVTLRGQTQTGLINNGQCVSIRGLTSVNAVPAVSNASGVMTLIDSTLTGLSGAGLINAITNGEYLFARNVATSGYYKALQNNVAGGYFYAGGAYISEFVSHPVLSQFASPQTSLNLPVQETPDVPWDDPATWANVRSFGASGTGPNGAAAGDGQGYDHADWAGAALGTKANGTVNLSSLNWTYATGNYGPTLKDRSTANMALKINGAAYTRGIGAHGPAEIDYNLAGGYQTFTSDIGVDDSAGGQGSVDFQVYADGVLLYDSYMMYGGTPVKHISVSVAGKNQLKLLVTDGVDDSVGVQKALDSGASTIYFPNGGYKISSAVFVRGAARRIIGCEAYIEIPASASPGFKVLDGSNPIVVFERISSGYNTTPTIENASVRTLVIRDCQNVSGNMTGSGDVFIEDVCVNPYSGWTFGHQNIWARQFNPENQGTHIQNNGGALWILGLKTERGGTLIDTESGGATELLGGLCYTTTAGTLAPMFVINNSSASFTIGEICYDGDPYTQLVSETRGAANTLLKRGSAPYHGSGSALPLYVGYANPTTRTASGTVTLESSTNPAQTVNFDFRPVSGGATLHRSQILTPVPGSSDGTFRFTDIPPGSYNVAVKGAKWLQKVAPLDLRDRNGTLMLFLPGGDANNDNSVDSSDFGLLIGAFNTAASLPGSGYDNHADFNDDSIVDSSDFGILIGNFGNAGDP